MCAKWVGLNARRHQWMYHFARTSRHENGWRICVRAFSDERLDQQRNVCAHHLLAQLFFGGWERALICAFAQLQMSHWSLVCQCFSHGHRSQPPASPFINAHTSSLFYVHLCSLFSHAFVCTLCLTHAFSSRRWSEQWCWHNTINFIWIWHHLNECVRSGCHCHDMEIANHSPAAPNKK